MENTATKSLEMLPLIALTAVGIGAAALIFAGWLHFADVIVLTFSESGLAFCL